MMLHLTGVQMLTNTSFEALIEISPFLGHILVLSILPPLSFLSHIILQNDEMLLLLFKRVFAAACSG